MSVKLGLRVREEHVLRMFENKVLRRMSGRKKDEVTGEWRKLHSGELHNLHLSPNNIRQIKSRRMRWAGHVERMGKQKKFTGFWWEGPNDGEYSGNKA
jgi:hypothetical protein